LTYHFFIFQYICYLIVHGNKGMGVGHPEATNLDNIIFMLVTGGEGEEERGEEERGEGGRGGRRGEGRGREGRGGRRGEGRAMCKVIYIMAVTPVTSK
jgi:hypothetical protein